MFNLLGRGGSRGYTGEPESDIPGQLFPKHVQVNRIKINVQLRAMDHLYTSTWCFSLSSPSVYCFSELFFFSGKTTSSEDHFVSPSFRRYNHIFFYEKKEPTSANWPIGRTEKLICRGCFALKNTRSAHPLYPILGVARLGGHGLLQGLRAPREDGQAGQLKTISRHHWWRR